MAQTVFDPVEVTIQAPAISFRGVDGSQRARINLDGTGSGLLTPTVAGAPSVAAYNAAGDVLDGVGTIAGGALSQLSVVHPLRPSGFTLADVGKKVIVLGAGSVVNGVVAMTGVPLVTTIQSVAGGIATLAAPAAGAVTSVRVLWGTDDSAAIAKADAAAQAVGAALGFPAGGFFAHSIASAIRGSGSDKTVIYRLPDATISGTFYALGNYLPLAGNPQAIAPTSVPDLDWSCESVTLDGLADPNNTAAWNGLQGNGIEVYALLRGHTRDVRVQNFAYGGVEIASNRAGSEHNDGSGNAGIQQETGPSGANLKEPQPVADFDCEGRLEAFNCGFQWGAYGDLDSGYLVNGAIAAAATSAVVCADNSRDVPNLAYWFPGQRIALGACGIVPPETPTNFGYETITIDHVDLVTHTVYFATPTLYAHADLAPIGAVNYWGDPGFGVIIREPARDLSLESVVADRCGWGGLSVGQSQNYKYDPLTVRQVHIGRVRIKRCGIQGAPLMKLGFFNGLSIGGGYIGDVGGLLYDAAVIGDTVIVLRTSEGRRFYPGEPINVGIPGAAGMEAVTVKQPIAYHTGTAKATNGSTTLQNVTGTWVVGEKIQGNQLPANTRVSGPGGQGTVLTNPASMTISNAATGNLTGMPIQGGDSLVLTAGLTKNHSVGEDVFCNIGTSPGIGLQEIGFTSSHNARISNLEIQHCYDGVQATVRTSDGATYENRRHTLTGIHSRRNVRHGFNHVDSQNVIHQGCIAEANGGTGIISTAPLGALANHAYDGCQSYGNLVADWNLVAASYKARGCLGLADDA